MENLALNNQLVTVDAGELVSFKVAEHEYIHQKGSLGWRSADTEMFPLIGPTADAGFKIKTPLGDASQDQHGLLREMEYVLAEETPTTLVYVKEYTANTPIKNSKFPAKSEAETLSWPYDFKFIKTFTVSDTGLEITFKVDADAAMPFMLGYHPAFKLHSKTPIIKTTDVEVTLSEILEVGSRAKQIANTTEIILKDAKELKIKTSGFGSFMLWTEVPNMVCIEPITFYPYNASSNELHKGFKTVAEHPTEFSVQLIP